MLHRKPGVALLVQPQHALDLLDRRPPARRFADPPIAQTRRPFIAKPVAPAPEGSFSYPKQLRCSCWFSSPR
jgi:hypothetical protein